MKKFLIILIDLIILLKFSFTQYNKDTFSIVMIDENNFVTIYKEHDISSQIIEKIPAGNKDLKTTWKTFNNKKDYWIEVEYNNQKGWVNRKCLTRNFGIFSENEKNKIENLLLNFTKSLQQKDFMVFKSSFYFLRGIIIYSDKEKKTLNFEFENLNLLWSNIFNENKNIMQDVIITKLLENILQILENEFEIEYSIEGQKNSFNIPIKMKNFQFIILKYNEKVLYIGVEFWNDKPFISCLCLFE